MFVDMIKKQPKDQAIQANPCSKLKVINPFLSELVGGLVERDERPAVADAALAAELNPLADVGGLRLVAFHMYDSGTGLG